MVEPLPRLLSLQELAQSWKVSPHTVRKWVREGKLQPLRLCRRLLFDPVDCARFINTAKQAGNGNS